MNHHLSCGHGVQQLYLYTKLTHQNENELPLNTYRLCNLALETSNQVLYASCCSYLLCSWSLGSSTLCHRWRWGTGNLLPSCCCWCSRVYQHGIITKWKCRAKIDVACHYSTVSGKDHNTSSKNPWVLEQKEQRCKTIKQTKELPHHNIDLKHQTQSLTCIQILLTAAFFCPPKRFASVASIRGSVQVAPKILTAQIEEGVTYPRHPANLSSLQHRFVLKIKTAQAAHHWWDELNILISHVQLFLS